MRIIEVEIKVESQRLENCSVRQCLHLFMIYFRMAWRALDGEISKIRIEPIYGADEQEPDLTPYEGEKK